MTSAERRGHWRRRDWWWGLVVGVWALACESEADRAEAVVRELAAALPQQRGETLAARRARLSERFRPRVADQVRIDVYALQPEVITREQAVQHAAELGRRPLSSVELREVRVDLDASERRARVLGIARVSASQAGDLHAPSVNFEAGLVRRKQQWWVEQLRVQEPRAPLPEARP